MGLSNSQRDQIANLPKEQIRHKLSAYTPESNNMPFYVRLPGQDRMAFVSFLQSTNTTFGISLFQEVAAIITTSRPKESVTQYKSLNNTLNDRAQSVIQRIVDDLRAARAQPNNPPQILEIHRAAQTGTIKYVKRTRIGSFLGAQDGAEYYPDLTTAKANVDDMIGIKRQLIEWVAIRRAINPQPTIYTWLASPYNPYEAQPYDRWTFQGMLGLPNDITNAKTFLGERTRTKNCCNFVKMPTLNGDVGLT